MGCDIHAFIEYRFREGADRVRQVWMAFHDGELSLGRSARLFSALAGVRKSEGDVDELIPARGFPKDASWKVFRGLYWPIVDEESERVFFDLGEDYVTRSCVGPKDVVVRDVNFEFVRDPDAHSISWLTYEEIGRCVAHAGVGMEDVDVWFQAAYAAMGKLEECCDTRLVFWFDN